MLKRFKYLVGVLCIFLISGLSQSVLSNPLSVRDIIFSDSKKMSSVARYINPKIQGKYWVDRCYKFAKQCNGAAAHAFCKRKKHINAIDWNWDYRAPTKTLGDNRVCGNKSSCGGYTYITCKKRPKPKPKKSFYNPKIEGKYWIDRCYNFARRCNGEAAHAFCRTKGFPSARDWKWSYHAPTKTLGDRRVCNKKNSCGGYDYIKCK